MFYEAVRTIAGGPVQIVTAVETITGVVLSVVEDVLIIRTTNMLEDGSLEEITVRISAILYIRCLSKL